MYTSGWITGKVNGNLFDSNLFHGFDFVADSLDIEICGNTFTNNGWYDWPVTELAGIYQGVFHYRPGTRIAIKNNKFYGNKVGYSCVKYYEEISESTQVRVSGNTIRDNELGVYAHADKYANLELILTRNLILNNQTLQVYHAYRASQILNLGNLENESTLDDGMNRIYATSGLAQYYMRNNTPDVIMAQGNYWDSKDSATIDRRIYDDDEDPGCGMVNFKYFATWGPLEPGTVWQGIVNIGGDVILPEGTTLTIKPKTEVRFVAGIDGARGGIDTARAEFIVYGEIESGGKGSGDQDISMKGIRLSGYQKNREKYEIRNTKFETDYKAQIHNDNNKNEIASLAGADRNDKNDLRIYFTSDAYEPAPGDWYGIRFIKEKHLKSKMPKYLDMENDERIETLNQPMKQVQGGRSGMAIRGNSGQERTIEGKRNGVAREIKDWVIEYAECGLYFSGDEIEVKSCSLLNNSIGGVINAEEFEVKETWFMDNNTGLVLENGEGEIKGNLIFDNDTGLVIKSLDGEIKENNLKKNNIGMYITDRGDDLRIGKYNTFDHNLLYHIYNNTPDSVDATNNYWYPSEPESIAYYIYDYYDDPDLGVVLFEPTANKTAGGPQGSEMPKQVRHDISISFGSNPTGHLVVSYNLLNPQKIEISVYDVCGRLVSKEQGTKEKGEYSFIVNDISNGVYFVKFKISKFETVRKIILLR